VRALALALVLAAPAHADLYRWVDPDSGSVKFSTLPPADPRLPAEVVPYRAPRRATAAPADSAAALEQRWRAMVLQLASRSPQDMSRDRGALRAELEAYESLRAQLDRLDPAGASRRAAETGVLAERLRAR
jgi:hypothetical protein